MTTTLEHPPVQQLPVRAATGVLDIDAHGKGLLRAESMLPQPSDLQVSPALIRKYGLRKGDLGEGALGAAYAVDDVALA